MHELSIAMNIIEIATEEVKKAGGGNIRSVELEVGALSGVVEDALKFALEVSVKDTVLENAQIDIRTIKAQAACNQCQKVFPVEDLFTDCPACHSYDSRLIRGNELRFASLLIE